MKPIIASLSLAALQVASSGAATTIDATNTHAWGANIGWTNWRGDVTNGAVVGEYVCSGYIYSANVGWIHLGDGTPVNNIQYQNNSAADFGLNVTYPSAGVALLRGYAYGANVGWINFEGQGNPRINLSTGQLLGYIWSANCGWINLSDTAGSVETDLIVPGADTDTDGIADAFEYQAIGNLATMNLLSDSDDDGRLDKNEYLEGTNPFDRTDSLRITLFSTTGSGVSSMLTWTSKPSRFYRVQKSPDLVSGFTTQLNNISPDVGATTSRVLGDTAAGKRFFRIQAFRPLVP